MVSGSRGLLPGPDRGCLGGRRWALKGALPRMELAAEARWTAAIVAWRKAGLPPTAESRTPMKNMLGTGAWFSRWASRREPTSSPARLLAGQGTLARDADGRDTQADTEPSSPEADESSTWPPTREEPEPQEPERGSVWQSLRRNAQAKCLLLTLLMAACLGAVAWCRLSEVKRFVINYHTIPMRSETRVSPCDDGYVYVPLALLSMLYLVYLVECWHCSTRLQLAYRVDASAVYDLVEQMREAQPIIWWKAVCYHYVRRTRLVTRYRNGDPYTTTQIYYDRVNTHAAGSCFVYTDCGVRDISKRLTGLENHPATKIRFSKGFAFANIEAARSFERQRSDFFRDNERFDEYMEMREGLDLVSADFQEYVVAFADRLPWYVSHSVFWLFSALLLSWPLRLLVDCRTAHVHYQVTKLFGEPPETTAPTQSVELSRRSTADSAELEQSITDNFTLAPSYSQAVLMDSALRSDPNGNIPISSRRHRSSWTGPGTSQVMYLVPPLYPDDVPVQRRCPDAGPPSYEEVVPDAAGDATALGFPRFLLPFTMRRSMTERNLARTPDGPPSSETQL